MRYTGEPPHFGGDLGQRPAPRQIAGQHELGPIDQPLASDAGAGRVRGARSQRPLHQGQGQALGFQRLGDALAQAVPQQRHQRLRPRIDPQALLPKGQRARRRAEGARRQLAQQRFADDQRQAGIAARHGMADPVAFGRR